MASEKLKPCPFCGKNTLLEVNRSTSIMLAFVACKSCGSDGPTKTFTSRAIAAWNNRPAGTAGEES